MPEASAIPTPSIFNVHAWELWSKGVDGGYTKILQKTYHVTLIFWEQLLQSKEKKLLIIDLSRSTFPNHFCLVHVASITPPLPPKEKILQVKIAYNQITSHKKCYN